MRSVPASVLALALCSTAAIAAPRDPFTSPMDVEPPPPAKNPLSRYALDELKLSGVVVGIATPKAMLEAPNGRVHFARIGDRIGKNGARVVRINRSGVTLVDEYRDVIGRLHRNELVISAPEPLAFALSDDE